MTVIEHNGKQYGLGRTINHDPRSKMFPAPTAALRTVHHQHHGPILDQGQLGSCTGNAMAQALNTGPLLPDGRRLLNEQDAVGIYSWATHHDGFPGVYPPTDTGSSGLAVAKAVRGFGLISSFHHAFGLQHCLGALVLSPVIIGVSWKSTMFEVGADGYLNIHGPTAGGHEVALIGLDVDLREVTLLNSWSAGWGVPAPECGIPDGGTARLAWTDLGDLLAQQGDVTVPVL